VEKLWNTKGLNQRLEGVVGAVDPWIGKIGRAPIGNPSSEIRRFLCSAQNNAAKADSARISVGKLAENTMSSRWPGNAGPGGWAGLFFRDMSPGWGLFIVYVYVYVYSPKNSDFRPIFARNGYIWKIGCIRVFRGCAGRVSGRFAVAFRP
jgi:hypothetical protein